MASALRLWTRRMGSPIAPRAFVIVFGNGESRRFDHLVHRAELGGRRERPLPAYRTSGRTIALGWLSFRLEESRTLASKWGAPAEMVCLFEPTQPISRFGPRWQSGAKQYFSAAIPAKFSGERSIDRLMLARKSTVQPRGFPRSPNLTTHECTSIDSTLLEKTCMHMDNQVSTTLPNSWIRACTVHLPVTSQTF